MQDIAVFIQTGICADVTCDFTCERPSCTGACEDSTTGYCDLESLAIDLPAVNTSYAVIVDFHQPDGTEGIVCYDVHIDSDGNLDDDDGVVDANNVGADLCCAMEPS
jgi:hypothetical protein